MTYLQTPSGNKLGERNATQTPKSRANWNNPTEQPLSGVLGSIVAAWSSPIHPFWPILPPHSGAIKSAKGGEEKVCTWKLFFQLNTVGISKHKYGENATEWFMELHNPASTIKKQNKPKWLGWHRRNCPYKDIIKGWHFKPFFPETNSWHQFVLLDFN